MWAGEEGWPGDGQCSNMYTCMHMYASIHQDMDAYIQSSPFEEPHEATGSRRSREEHEKPSAAFTHLTDYRRHRPEGNGSWKGGHISTELTTEQYSSFSAKDGQEGGCHSGQEKGLEKTIKGSTLSSVLIYMGSNPNWATP